MKTRKSKRLLIKSNWFEKFINKNNFTAQLTDPFFKTAGRYTLGELTLGYSHCVNFSLELATVYALG